MTGRCLHARNLSQNRPVRRGQRGNGILDTGAVHPLAGADHHRVRPVWFLYREGPSLGDSSSQNVPLSSVSVCPSFTIQCSNAQTVRLAVSAAWWL